MPLFVVATPIGNSQDFSLRALEILRQADVVIGEELKVLRQTMKAAGVQGIPLEQLNEHSRADDIAHFVEMCREKNVALVSDCGTPGFCDPGADLVAACRQEKILVKPIPGASSLMALLSVCGARVEQFLFYGFLPAKTQEREKALAILRDEKRAIVLLETPYRCERLIEDLAKNFAGRECVLGLDLTAETEVILRARGNSLSSLGPFKDREPIVLILPN